MLKNTRAQIDCDGILKNWKFGYTKAEVYKPRKREEKQEKE